MGLVHARPTVTIIADASVNHEKKVAGWGAWMSSRSGNFETGFGPLDFSPHTDLMELLALQNMMSYGWENGWIDNHDKSIILQTDNLRTMQLIARGKNTWPAKKKHPHDTQVTRAQSVGSHIQKELDHFLHLIEPFQIVYVRHVKGHRNPKQSGRHGVNNRCDHLAKLAVKQQLLDAKNA